MNEACYATRRNAKYGCALLGCANQTRGPLDTKSKHYELCGPGLATLCCARHCLAHQTKGPLDTKRYELCRLAMPCHSGHCKAQLGTARQIKPKSRWEIDGVVFTGWLSYATHRVAWHGPACQTKGPLGMKSYCVGQCRDARG